MKWGKEARLPAKSSAIAFGLNIVKERQKSLSLFRSDERMSYQITKNDLIFQHPDDPELFEAAIIRFYDFMLEDTGVAISYSKVRMLRAHSMWRRELDRLEGILNNQPCEFKSAGALTHWLYKEQPVDSWDFSAVTEKNMQENGIFIRFVAKNAREHFPFKFSFDTCRNYVLHSDRKNGKESNYTISEKFIKDIVYFMRNDYISSGSLYLIFLSIFRRNGTEFPGYIQRPVFT